MDDQEERRRAQPTIDRALEILNRWDTKPPAPKRHLSKKEFVKALASGVKALQDKGYTLVEIAGFLRDEEHYEIAPATLKNYLQRAKTTGAKNPRRTKAKASTPGPTTDAAAATTPAELPASSDADSAHVA